MLVTAGTAAGFYGVTRDENQTGEAVNSVSQ